MFEYEDVSGLDAAAALSVLERAQQVKRQAEVQEAFAMLRVVHTYRHQIPTDKKRLAGHGTDLIDDFACLELAAALHRSVDSVTGQVIDLLNLETRLPQVWEAVVSCGVPMWVGRKVAEATRDLTLVKARWVDATIAPFAARLAPGRLLRFVAALVVRADPEAADRRWAKRGRARVDIGTMQSDGLRDIYGWLDVADATYLDAALNQLSDILAAQGSDQDAQERRAAALGILATPARALAMIQAAVSQPPLVDSVDEPRPESPISDDERPAPVRHDEHGPRSPFGCAGHSCGRITVAPEKLLPKATLVIHLSDESLISGTGVGRCEELGPLTVDQIRSVLGHARVVVRPVFDPDGIAPVDAYEIPERLRRAVLLRHPVEVFPYGTRSATGLDLDHTVPYVPGRKGQTRLDNLGPLRRRAHRAKTHAGWQLAQPRSGLFVWISPLGRRYVVSPAGLTTDLTPPVNPWDGPVGGPLLPEPFARRRRRPGRTRQHSRAIARPKPRPALRP